jgi:hypothetical protein
MLTLDEMIDITIRQIDYNLENVTIWRYLISLLLKKLSVQTPNQNQSLDNRVHEREEDKEEGEDDDVENVESNRVVVENEWMLKVHWWRDSLFFPSTQFPSRSFGKHNQFLSLMLSL